MLESLPNASHRMLVRAQHYFFFPILLFARLSWCQQSVAHAYSLSKVQLPHSRPGALACHQSDAATTQSSLSIGTAAVSACNIYQQAKLSWNKMQPPSPMSATSKTLPASCT